MRSRSWNKLNTKSSRSNQVSPIQLEANSECAEFNKFNTQVYSTEASSFKNYSVSIKIEQNIWHLQLIPTKLSFIAYPKPIVLQSQFDWKVYLVHLIQSLNVIHLSSKVVSEIEYAF